MTKPHIIDAVGCRVHAGDHVIFSPKGRGRRKLEIGKVVSVAKGLVIQADDKVLHTRHADEVVFIDPYSYHYS